MVIEKLAKIEKIWPKCTSAQKIAKIRPFFCQFYKHILLK